MTRPDDDEQDSSKHESQVYRLGPDSVLGQLKPFEWSQEESVNFEVALEVINMVVATCSHLRDVERKRPVPDQQRIEHLDAVVHRCVEERRALRSTDHDEVARVTREYAALERALEGRTEHG